MQRNAAGQGEAPPTGRPPLTSTDPHCLQQGKGDMVTYWLEGTTGNQSKVVTTETATDGREASSSLPGFVDHHLDLKTA